MTLPALSLEARADLIAARSRNQVVFLKERPPLSTACPNCGGYGSHWFQFAQAGPYQSAPGDPSLVAYATGEGWYKVESKFYPCPSCYNHTTHQRHLWDQSGLEENERDWHLKYFAGTGKERLLEACNELVAMTPKPTGWLTLYGDYGRGKSGALKSVVAALVRAGTSARYVRSADILQEIRSTYGDNGVTEQDIIMRYGGIALLAIDEVDRISVTPWAQSTMMTILDTRYTRRLSVATILATNTPPDRLGSEYGYLASRMRDGEIVHVAGKDLRG